MKEIEKVIYKGRKRRAYWVQKHREQWPETNWRIHYIKYNTEYSTGDFVTKLLAEKELLKGYGR